MQQPRINGSALIYALIIMSVITILITLINLKLHNDIKRTSLIINRDQLYLAIDLIKFWAIQELKKPNKNKKTNQNQNTIIQSPNTLNKFTAPIKISGIIFYLRDLKKIDKILHKKIIFNTKTINVSDRICIATAKYLKFNLMKIFILH